MTNPKFCMKTLWEEFVWGLCDINTYVLGFYGLWVWWLTLEENFKYMAKLWILWKFKI